MKSFWATFYYSRWIQPTASFFVNFTEETKKENKSSQEITQFELSLLRVKS